MARHKDVDETTMEDAVVLLLMLFVLVTVSFALDRYSCMLVSQSGFAMVFGLIVGLFMIMGDKHAALHTHLNLDNSLFFNVLLPPIIYEGGFSIKRQAFFRNFPAIMSTAVIGTIVSAVITGGVLYFAGSIKLVTRLSWVEALLFGTLINAVDPVATLSCFNKLHVPPLLFNLVFGESVINNAVAIALYQTLHKWDAGIDLSAKQLLHVVINTGGILLTYYVADSLKLSGIVALFFSGTMTAHYHFNSLSREARHAFTHLLHTVAFVCENVVCVFMGTSVIMIFSGHTEKNSGSALRVDDIDWHFIGLTLVACFVARFFNIFPLLSLSNWSRSSSDRIPVKYMSVMWFVALRGSIAFALAKNWNYVGLHGASHRQLVESTTLVVVLFTTIVVGGLTGPVLSALHLTGHHSALRQSDPESNSDDSSTSSEDRARAVQRGSRHFVLHPGSRTTELFTMPAGEQETALDDDPVLTSRPQFRDSVSDEEEGIIRQETDQDSPANGSRGETLTGVFFRNWETFDTTYMQPIFGGLSQSRTNPRPVDEGAEDQQLAKMQTQSDV
ncbi:hypothetical protein BBJ29_007822 [Phytophthora kernoviae]|uniref:Cation/H+ exchanger transmembrane domain-containing protein n=1 Tax=Phytophthora kernoviae TaxID=325452 RepID=A0A3R7JJF6_9STRA|nr:hypothetical protein BBJ29_007822 [Phytophthora kernoviae]